MEHGGNMENLIKKSFIRKILELICILIGFANQIIPKRKNCILFFETKTDYLNNYSLFKYMLENKYNLKYKMFYGMENLGIKEKNVYAIKNYLHAVYLYLTCQYCFFDTGNMRIKPSKNQKVINLWHGTPLKRIGFMSNSVEKSLPKNLMNTFTSICVASSKFDDIYIKSFNLKERQILHCAQPRLDDLKKNVNSLNRIGIDKREYKKVIMWMTTYRISKDGRLHHTREEKWTDTNLPILETLSDLDYMNEYLSKKEIFLLIKIHRTSIFNEEMKRVWSHIKLITEEDFIPKGLQLYELLGECDALITDYSSVYFDYLILDKPICFIVKDYEEYKETNGFTLESPLEYMPGMQISEMDELFEFINNLIANRDDYKEKREEVNIFCNEFVCDSNSERILELAGIKRG